mgnify:CR=1 FL=1
MRKITDLSDMEANRCAMDMAEIQCNATKEIVRLADKYRISRDETMKHFSTVMMFMAKSMSFEDYKTSEEVKHANRG